MLFLLVLRIFPFAWIPVLHHLNPVLLYVGKWGSSFRIVTRLQSGRLLFGLWQGPRSFSSTPPCPHRLWGPLSLPVTSIQCRKNTWSCTSTLQYASWRGAQLNNGHVFRVWHLVKYRDKLQMSCFRPSPFTFYCKLLM